MKSIRPKSPDDNADEPLTSGGGRNPGCELSRPEAIECHARLEHRSISRLYKKGAGKEAKLCFIGRGLMESRYGLLVDACPTQADRYAERVAALHVIERNRPA